MSDKSTILLSDDAPIVEFFRVLEHHVEVRVVVAVEGPTELTAR